MSRQTAIANVNKKYQEDREQGITHEHYSTVDTARQMLEDYQRRQQEREEEERKRRQERLNERSARAAMDIARNAGEFLRERRMAEMPQPAREERRSIWQQAVSEATPKATGPENSRQNQRRSYTSPTTERTKENRRLYGMDTTLPEGRYSQITIPEAATNRRTLADIYNDTATMTRWRELASKDQLTAAEKQEARAARKEIKSTLGFSPSDVEGQGWKTRYSSNELPLVEELFGIDTSLNNRTNVGAGIMAGVVRALGIDWLSDRIFDAAGIRGEDGSVSPVKSTTTAIQTAQPGAFTAGNIAGSTAELLTISGAVGNAMKGVKWFTEAAPWIQKAISSGITFGINGLQSGITSTRTKEEWDEQERKNAALAAEFGATYTPREYNPWKQVANVGISTGAGALAGAAGGALETVFGIGTSKALIRYGLQYNTLFRAIANGINGVGFAAGSTAIQEASKYLQYPEGYTASTSEIASNLAVAFLFSSVSSVISDLKAAPQNRENLLKMMDELTREYAEVEMKMAGQTGQARRETAQRVTELTARIRNSVATSRGMSGVSNEIKSLVAALDIIDDRMAPIIAGGNGLLGTGDIMAQAEQDGIIPALRLPAYNGESGGYDLAAVVQATGNNVPAPMGEAPAIPEAPAPTENFPAWYAAYQNAPRPIDQPMQQRPNIPAPAAGTPPLPQQSAQGNAATPLAPPVPQNAAQSPTGGNAPLTLPEDRVTMEPSRASVPPLPKQTEEAPAEEKAKQELRGTIRMPVQGKNVDALEQGAKTGELTMDSVSIGAKVPGFTREQQTSLATQIIEGTQSGQKEITAKVPDDGTFAVPNQPGAVAQVLNGLKVKANQEVEITQSIDRYMRNNSDSTVTKIGDQSYVGDKYALVAVSDSAADYAAKQYNANRRNLNKSKFDNLVGNIVDTGIPVAEQPKVYEFGRNNYYGIETPQGVRTITRRNAEFIQGGQLYVSNNGNYLASVNPDGSIRGFAVLSAKLPPAAKQVGFGKLKGISANDQKPATSPDSGLRLPSADVVQPGVEIAEESTVVNDNPSAHTKAEQRVIEEYKNSVNEEVREAFEKYLADPDAPFGRYKISDVTARQAEDAARLLGGDYSGYTNNINKNGITHILYEHGPNGTVNHSMADLNDAARIGYVLDNYDSVEIARYKKSGEPDFSKEFADKNNRPAPKLKFSKKVNGTYYVIEAVPESNYKKFWVVSAYIGDNNAEDITQAPDAPGPQNTPTAQLPSLPSAEDRVAQTGKTVNTPTLRLPTEEAPVPAKPGQGLSLETETAKEENRSGQQNQEQPPLPRRSGDRSFRERAEIAARQNDGRSGRRSGLGRWLEDLRTLRSSEERIAEQRRESTRLKNAAAVGNLTGISGAEAGIEDGSNEQTAFLMPESLMSDAQKEAIRRYAEQGFKLRFIIGQLGTTSTSRRGDPISVRAHISDNGDIYVQADHRRLSWEQLLDHEELHREIENNPALRQKIMDALLSSKQVAPQLLSILNRYAEAYADMGITDENKVVDELLCDYKAGFDMLDAASKTARERMGDYRTKAAARETIRATEQEAGQKTGTAEAETAQSSGTGRRASIEPTFTSSFQQWVQNGRPGGTYINVGVTPDKFSDIGIKPRRFSWDTSKLNEIQKKHPYMTDDIVQQASRMIDDPVVILASKTQPNSAVFFGEVYVNDENGNPIPVMAALQLTPTRNGYTIDEYKIASIYAREQRDIPSTKATQDLLDSSEFLYVNPDKKRTQDWLRLTRLQLPFMPEQYGFMHKISLVSRDVNGNFSSGNGNAGLQDWQKKLADALNAMDNSAKNSNAGNRSIEIDPEEAALYRPEAIARRQAQGRRRNPNSKRKVSRVRSNTYNASGLFNEVEAQMDEADEQNYTYDPITEKRSLNEARGRLRSDFDGEVSKLSQDNYDWGGSDLDTAMGILHQYRTEGRQTGDYSAFWNWSKTIQEKGTKGGQFVQAFAKYTRTGTGQAQKAAEDLRKQFALNPAQEQQVKKTGERVRKAVEDSTQDAADDALKQAKGRKQSSRKEDTRESQRRKDAERLVREIYEQFNRRQRDHGEPVENWMNLTGEELARKIAGRFSEPKSRTRTTMQTILSDLVGFAQEHALPERQKAEGQRRTAIDTITDYLSNRDAYGTAWAQAQAVLRAQYAEDQEKLDALEGFLGATIGYNAEGTDRTMLDAILQSADVLGISERRILELASAGATASTIDRIGDELVNQVKVRMGEDYDERFTGQLKDAVRRHVTGIALQESAEDQRLRLGRLEQDAARNLDIQLQKLLTESKLTKQDAARRVADYLIRELDIPAADAAIAAQRIGESFMDELADRADKRLQNMFAEKSPRAKEQRDKLLDLLRLGGFTNANVEDAVVDALGIGKLSREEQRRITADLARFGETLDAMQEDDLEGLRQLIREQAAVRGTKLSRMSEKMLAGETDAEYLRDFAMAQLASIAGDYAPRNAGAKISTFQTISHLLNMRTALRNLTSNQVFDLVDSAANNLAVVPDMVIGAMTGKRTVGVNKSWASRMKRQGAIQGAGRNALEVNLDVSPDDRQKSKYGTAGRRTNSMADSNAFGRILSHLEEVMGYELNTTDEFHKGSVRGETLESLARLVERGDMTQEEANAFAEEEALYRSFQDDTLAGNLMGEAKRLLNMIGFGDSGKTTSRGKPIHDFGLGDLVVKYTQVPGALIHRGIEYSPLGYAKMIYDLVLAKDSLVRTKRRGENTNAAQRRLALDIGRATTGSGLIALFATLALAGLLRRDDDDKDKNAKAMHAAQGLSGTQLNVTALGRWIEGEDAQPKDGDVLADIGFLEPLDSLMTIATLLARDKDLSISDVGVKSLDGIWKAISNTSAMQTISNIISTVQYHDEENDLPLYFQIPIEIASDSISGFVPSPVRQLAQATDTTYRDQYRSKSLNDQVRAKVMNSVPGVRQMLAPKITPLGEDKKYQKPLLNYLNATLNPGNINVYQASDVVDELNRVYGETDDAKIWPERNAPYSITVDEEKYTLTPDERTQYQRTRGQTTANAMEAVMGTDWYKTMDASSQAEVMNWIGNFANFIAKKEMLDARGQDYGSKTYDKYFSSWANGTPIEDVVAEKYGNLVQAAEETAAAEAIIAEAKIPEASKAEAETMSAEAKRYYAGFLKGGVSDETARKLAAELEGSETSGHEQWRKVYDSAGKEGEKAVTSVMTDDMKRNWNLAKDTGVSMDDYIKVRENFKDLNGNGNKSQDEWNATLDSFTFSTNAAKDKSIKGTLWQILTGSGSTKNNPYDKEAGQKVIDAKSSGGGGGSGSYAPLRLPTLRQPWEISRDEEEPGLTLAPLEKEEPRERRSSGLKLSAVDGKRPRPSGLTLPAD